MSFIQVCISVYFNLFFTFGYTYIYNIIYIYMFNHVHILTKNEDVNDKLQNTTNNE